MAEALGPLACPSRSARLLNCLNLTNHCQFNNCGRRAVGSPACFSRSAWSRKCFNQPFPYILMFFHNFIWNIFLFIWIIFCSFEHFLFSWTTFCSFELFFVYLDYYSFIWTIFCSFELFLFIWTFFIIWTIFSVHLLFFVILKCVCLMNPFYVH